MSKSLFSYVVRYDSGFAPNPFYGYCTLATCKAGIRKSARPGDWVVGTGSTEKSIRRGGYLVYAMCVTKILCTVEYWNDPRFQCKKPNVNRTWMTASGDNIYECLGSRSWRQLRSYHSKIDGSPNERHIERDTKIQKILVSDHFVYFGGEGPKLPQKFRSKKDRNLVKDGPGYKRKLDSSLISSFENLVHDLGVLGLQGKPLDWIRRRD